MSTTSFNNLPDEATAQIFLRLPVKALIRSTSVNKKWYCLINNPSFIYAQIHHSISHCHDNAVLIIPSFISQQNNYCSLISADTSSVIEKFDIPFITRSSSLKFIVEVHGMLLLTDLHIQHSFKELFVWNPYVKKYRVLLSSCFKKRLDDRDKSCYAVGMGFDNITSDYKVVRIVYVKDDKGEQFGEVDPKVEVYSFRTNTWRKMKDPRVPRFVYDYGVYVDGCYYWLELTSHGNEKIMSFDFRNEVFGELKARDNVPHDLGRTLHRLIWFEDSPALCVLDTPIRVEEDLRFPYCIWLMRQENGQVTWTLRFRALLKEYGYPLAITKNETLIIESFDSDNYGVTSIVSCNLKSMIHKDHGFGKAGDLDVPYAYDPSGVGTSFPESLIMYEGGKSLLKYAKQL